MNFEQKFEIDELGKSEADIVGSMMVDFMDEVAPGMQRRPPPAEYSEAMKMILERGGAVLGVRTSPNDLIGFACVVENVSMISAGPHLELTELYVTPNFRNLGLGGMLIDRVEHLCKKRGHRRVLLCTGVSDLSLPPNSLYVRRGYEYLGPNLRKLV